MDQLPLVDFALVVHDGDYTWLDLNRHPFVCGCFQPGYLLWTVLAFRHEPSYFLSKYWSIFRW
jgi:hypothetical protein